jgi:hypothetical protein
MTVLFFDIAFGGSVADDCSAMLQASICKRKRGFALIHFAALLWGGIPRLILSSRSISCFLEIRRDCNFSPSMMLVCACVIYGVAGLGI